MHSLFFFGFPLTKLALDFVTQGSAKVSSMTCDMFATVKECKPSMDWPFRGQRAH